ncbi:MAG: radical SAM protein [Verrucomicrobiota bacterium]|nr:radical SAM protein [Verrucomicrobiota bacterium]
MSALHYPTSPVERSRWILSRRGPRHPANPAEPYAAFIEQERNEEGVIADVATIFLTNRECPWKCVMCDLWRNTTESPVAIGSITQQIRHALQNFPRTAKSLKLYNSGSFFDSGAVSKKEWRSIAELCRPFKRVIIECHPRLVGKPVLEFASLVNELEIAIGLETCHPQALDSLNKRFSIQDYRRSAEFIVSHGMALRTFLLVCPPFIPMEQQLHWQEQSMETAFAAGSAVVSFIGTRSGNGALEELEKLGLFCEPILSNLESAQEQGIVRRLGRVFADTWDIERFSRCNHCSPKRIQRIHRMNLTQSIEPRLDCPDCEDRDKI